MKILIISPVPTHPSNSGNSNRILQLAEELKSQQHDVWFFHINFQVGDPSQMQSYWGAQYIDGGYQKPWKKYRFKGIPIPDRWHHKPLLKGWLHQRVDQFFDDGVLEELKQLHQQQGFDAVMIEYVFFSKALEVFPDSVIKVIDTHDVYTDRHKKLIEQGLTPEWFFTSQYEEKRGLKRAAKVIGIQEQETAYFQKLLAPAKIETVTIGHLFDLPDTASITSFSTPLRFGMLGSGNNLNIQAYEWFISEVMPKLPESFVLHLIGTICKHVNNHKQVNKVGMVDQLSDAYQTADVFINPMQWGTGLKIKSIEALSFGRLLLSTDCGLEGLETAISQDCLLLNSSDQWCEAIQTLLSDSTYRGKYSELNHQFAASYLKTNTQSLNDLFAASF